MKICFITGEYPPMQGGVGDCTRELSRALLQLGHEVIVLTSTKAAVSEHSPHSEPARDGPGYSRASLQSESRHTGGGSEPLVLPVIRHWGWKSWTRILQIVREYEIDVAHVEYQTGAFGMHPAVNFLPLRLRLTRNRPLTVFTFHDLRVPYLFPKAGVVRRWVTLSPAYWSDCVIATDQEDYDQLAQLSPPLHSQLRYIPIGSNIHPQPPPGYDRRLWRQRIGVSEDEVLLCYFGFLNESKGGETLFRSLSALRRRGYAAKLLMIGGQVGDSDPTNSAYLARVQNLSQELGLTDWISWTGYTEPELVSANFMAADVCVLPYRDGVSYRRGSLMAALAHGLPIVSTQPRRTSPAKAMAGRSTSLAKVTAGREVSPTSGRGSTSHALADGENILLVPVDNPEAIADAIQRLLLDPALCTKLSRGALDLAKSFTWDQIASQTAGLYAEAMHLQRAHDGR